MKRHWVIVFVVIIAGLALTTFFFAKPEDISNDPVRIPVRTEIIPAGSSASGLIKTIDEGQTPQLMRPTPLVRAATKKLLEISCPTESKTCQLRAIYDFVRTNFEFTERSLETPYIRPPGEMLIYGRGDKMEIAVLLASMQRAAGFRNEIVRSNNGAWVRVYEGNESIMIDPSCSGCKIMGASVILRGDEIVYS